MQVAGIIPKTERKPKHPPANKIDISNGFHSAEKLPSPSLSNGNIKKDPGAVFKFEEDSSDIHDVFPYKNGLVGTLNGKGKSCKSRDNSTSYNASKDIKNVKTQYGTTKNLTPNITTKKITDKNKNVYTAVVVPTTGSCVNSNSSGNKVSNSKSKTTCWSNAAAPAASEANPIASVVTTKSSNIVTKVHSSELNILHDSEDIRQFEQLKTLKQLDKSLQSSEINPKDGSGGEDAKSQVFPRLTLPRIKSNAVSSQSSERKSEIASTSPPPPTPLISRSNNSIIIKTESQIAPLVKLEIKKDNDDEVDGDKSVNIEKQRTNHSDHFLLSPSGSNDSSNQSSIGSNDHCSSIDKDLKNRHEFLAHVRHSFKSQYKSLRKACKFSEKYEQNGKQKLRDSLVRCVRIDTSICAQVLLGYGLKLPPLYTPIKIEVETKNENGRKQEFDDYDFVDNESAFPINKINTATATSEQKSKKGKISSIIGGKPNKSSSSSKPTNLRSGKKGKEVDQEESNSNPGQSDGGDKKGRGKGQQDLVTKESKSKSSSSTLASGKRKLKRADAISVSSENSLGSGGERLNESVVSLNNNNADNSDGIKKKKQKMDLNEMSALENELGLSLNDQSSPDERISSSAHHQTLTQGSGVHAIGELHDILENSQLSSSASSHRNQGLETVLNSVGSSENAGTPDGVITDASFDSTFEHSTSSQPGISKN